MSEEIKNPPWQQVDNAIAATLTDQYGFLPLHVRHDAAKAARRVVDAWREELNPPNPFRECVDLRCRGHHA